MLQEAALFLAAAVLFVPLFKRLKLGAVLGYLMAGLVIGPHGLGFAHSGENLLHFSEFGVVLLMFVIGLELQPSRLWHLRREVFGLGGAQVLGTAAAFTPLAYWAGLAWPTAIAVALALAMSSTALALQMLGERKELTSPQGRAAFAVLLFQDLAVIPLLALLPLLNPVAGHSSSALAVAKALGMIALVVLAGRTLLNPLLRRLASSGLPEIFTAAALLLVIGVSLAMQVVGLSASLGAFLAGMLLADSQFRHELQADLEPFKGLLLGLFFIAVGMGADLRLVLSAPLTVLGLSLGLLAVKAAVMYGLARASGQKNGGALKLAAVLSQGGEFAFVLFGVMGQSQLLPPATLALLTVAVTISMMLSPAIYAITSKLKTPEPPAPYDEINAAATPVLIVGFGPFGQIIGRILRLKKIAFTVLDKDAQHVDFVRSFGNPVFYSDASRAEVLRAAHISKARLLIVAISNEADSLRVIQAAQQLAPTLRIMSSARTRQHALRLMALGLAPDDVIRRTYFSSLELTRRVLTTLGLSAEQAARTVATFQQKDQETLMRQQAVAQDENALREVAVQFSRELEQLFEADQGQ